jgi:hypothetical protein
LETESKYSGASGRPSGSLVTGVLKKLGVDLIVSSRELAYIYTKKTDIN